MLFVHNRDAEGRFYDCFDVLSVRFVLEQSSILHLCMYESKMMCILDVIGYLSFSSGACDFKKEKKKIAVMGLWKGSTHVHISICLKNYIVFPLPYHTADVNDSGIGAISWCL